MTKLRTILELTLLLSLYQHHVIHAFTGMDVKRYQPCRMNRHTALNAETGVQETSALATSVDKLKKVLRREYISFFDPMQCEYYSDNVSFEDPMTALEGVQSYKNNVDMLASRTLMGKFLFSDAGIVLHSVEGGEINPSDGRISNIVTRLGSDPVCINLLLFKFLRILIKILSLTWSWLLLSNVYSVYNPPF